MRNKLVNAFTHKHGEIAKFIYSYTGDYTYITLDKISHQFKIAPSTVTKFIQEMGFTSFKSMIHQLHTYSTFNTDHSTNLLYNYILDDNQKKAYLQICTDIIRKNDIIIFNSYEYTFIANEFKYRFNNVNPQQCTIHNLSSFISKPCDNCHIIVFGYLDEVSLLSLIALQHQITIIGYESNFVSKPQSQHINYIIFKDSPNHYSIHLILLLELFFADFKI